MLKWLVQKNPHQSNPNLEIITDNPLAALQFDGRFSTGKAKGQGIYSVNRTNPLYDAEDGKWVNHGFEQREEAQLKVTTEPNATRSSRTSSGYGSQDSQPKLGVRRGSQALGHTELTSRHEIETFRAPPRPVWPSSRGQHLIQTTETASSNHVPISFVHTNGRYVSSIGMFGNQPGPNVFNVIRNAGFVSRIQFGGARSLKPPLGPRLSHERSKPLSPIHENYVFHEAGPNDSIVTESLLQLTSFNPTESNRSSSEITSRLEVYDVEGDDEAICPPSGMLRKNEDMDNVIRELTQAVIKSRNRSTLTKAMGSRLSNPQSSMRRTYLRNSIRTLRSISRGQGKEVMRDLWQKSGMKTNGRKLLPDSLSEGESQDLGGARAKYHRKRGRKVPKRNSSVGSSSTSSNSTVSEGYQSPSARQQLSSGIYAEVYKTSSQNSSVRKAFDRGLIHGYAPGANPDEILEDLDSISVSESDPRQVRFSQEVVDNEGAKDRLVYDFVPRTSPSRARDRNDVIIDVARLNERDGYPTQTGGAPLWERYYGAHGKFAGDPIEPQPKSAKKTDYRTIFSSPYFDYRKSNSRGETVRSKSDPLISNLVGRNSRHLKHKPHIRLTSARGHPRSDARFNSFKVADAQIRLSDGIPVISDRSTHEILSEILLLANASGR
eukprot:maker-scaffold713_size108309-snap-gene-0.12 protein:Tk04836 transcript:maker-scaffold713_size108309-snap-gene-0.12-mRNA-1 annotation:"hypothetical protein L798_06166"